MNKSVLIRFLFCLIATLFYIAGLIFFLTDHEPGDRCEMTYMFEYPQYVKIYHEIDDQFPKYGLYAYAEGRTTKKARNMYFDGIPVIFIPGNAGSHHQARSLASVALRKYLNSKTPYHFDYFTIDLNSEFSALYGPTLFEQQEYVLSAVDRVLELYKNSPSNPSQVVLIGHSVGGVVARKVVSNLLKQKKPLVSILLGLAVPFLRGPIYFDRYASNFYASSHLKGYNGVSISVAGGYSDILVPSYLTVNEGNRSLNLVATNVAKCWVESNHVQILWCKQLVLALNRALFDSVDQHSLQISTNSDYVRDVFHHHLIHNSGSNIELSGEVNKIVKIDYKGKWIEHIQKQYTVEFSKGLREAHWYMVAITMLPTYEMLTVLAINLEVTNWAFACNAAYPNKGGRVCVEGEHLTQYSEITPTNRFKKRLLTVNMHEIRKQNKAFTHVVFRGLPTDEPLTFHVDIYGSYERETTVSLPFFSLQKRVILTQTPEKALIYNLLLPELENPLQMYQLYVEPLNCQDKEFYATASLFVPWANESVHWHFTPSETKPFNLRLQNGKPTGAGNAKVRLILQPSCTYKISVRLHLIGIFGQLARYYSTFFVSTLATVFLLTFQSQLREMYGTKRVPIFFSSLADGMKEMWIPVCCFIVGIILKKYIFQPEYSTFPGIIYQGIAMTILVMVSYVAISVLTACYCLSLFTLESTVHKGLLKLLAKSVTLTFRFSDYFVKFLHKVSFIAAAALIALCFSACGGLALWVGLVFYFLKLTQMSQDYVEQIAWFILKVIAKRVRKLFTKSDKKKPSVKEALLVKGEKNVTPPSCSKTTLDENTSEEGNTIETPDSNGASDTQDKINQNINNQSKSVQKELTQNVSSEEIEKVEIKTKAVTDAEQPPKNNLDVDLKDAKEPGTGQPEAPSQFKLQLTETNNAIFFHSSIFFIWVFVAVLNVPAVLTWAHNFKYSRNLTPDESLLPGLVFSIGAFFLWQFDLPRTNRKFGWHLRLLTLSLVPISFLYGSVSVYRINYLFTMLFALVLLQQFAAPKMEEPNNSGNDSEAKDEQNKYDEMKMKID